MENQLENKKTYNPITRDLMDSYIKQIFEAAIIYRKFEEI